MYVFHLISKYLRRKLAPVFAMLAVTLCTAMVIIVISVMGGFLDMMQNSVRKLSGDMMITIRGDLRGFPRYEEMLAELGKMPEVKAATPSLHTYGLASGAGRLKTVEIVGIDPAGMDAVTGFRDALHWRKETILGDLDRREQRAAKAEKTGKLDDDLRTRFEDARRFWSQWDFERYGMEMQPPPTWVIPDEDKPTSKPAPRDGAIPGIAVFNRRDGRGQYSFQPSIVTAKLTLTALRLSPKGAATEPAVREFTIVNEFKSGLYEIDANRVYIPFDVLQKMLKMDAYDEVNPDTGDPTGERVPGRATEIMIRAVPGADLSALQKKIDDMVFGLSRTHPDIPVFVEVLTWRQRHEGFLGAVEKEKGLLVFLFAIISLVAVAMVAVIFYMIVLEKTRDIGVLRALGASRMGIASIFLSYGLTIGVIGAAAGLGLAAIVVTHLNDIQDFLGRYAGVALFHLACALVAGLVVMIVSFTVFGVRTPRGIRISFAVALGVAVLAGLCAFPILNLLPQFRGWLDANLNFIMWDPAVYYFDRIPARLSPVEVRWIVLFAVLSSVIGSIVPAILAARVDPVESLRYE